VDNFLSRWGNWIKLYLFLQLSKERFFCYTIIHGKICNPQKGEAKKKTRVFGQNEVSRRTKSGNEKKTEKKSKTRH
jgi:hypothetical protein